MAAYLYIGDTDRVWRVPYQPGDLKPRGPIEPVTDEGAIGAGSGHWTRNVAVSPDGGQLFVSIGSAGNIGEEAAPRATMVEAALATRKLRRESTVMLVYLAGGTITASFARSLRVVHC